jgi:hypothetical protein
MYVQTYGGAHNTTMNVEIVRNDFPAQIIWFTLI